MTESYLRDAVRVMRDSANWRWPRETPGTRSQGGLPVLTGRRDHPPANRRETTAASSVLRQTFLTPLRCLRTNKYQGTGSLFLVFCHLSPNTCFIALFNWAPLGIFSIMAITILLDYVNNAMQDPLSEILRGRPAHYRPACLLRPQLRQLGETERAGWQGPVLLPLQEWRRGRVLHNSATSVQTEAAAPTGQGPGRPGSREWSEVTLHTCNNSSSEGGRCVLSQDQ